MNVPKLRFKEFNDEWDYKIFDELINIKSESYNPSLNKENYKCIELEHINQNTGTINGYCNSQDQKSNKNIFKKNEVLFGKLRPYLKKYWYATFDGVCSSEIWVGKSKNQNIVTNKFIYDLFQSHYFLQLCNLSTGSKMPRADWSFIKEQSIAIPNILEQKKISETLELLDKKIELQSKKIEDLKLFKMSTLDKYFNKDTCKEKALLKKYCSCLTGKSKADKVDINGKYYIMDMGTVNSDGNILKTKPTFCNFDLLSYGDLVMPKDDIGGGLIIGKTGFIDEDNKYVLGDHVYLLKVNDINSLFLHYQINSKYINKQLKRKVTGSAQLGLKSDNILNQEIYIYSEEEQKKIANIFKLIDRKIELETEKIFKLINLKKGLMQNMFV